MFVIEESNGNNWVKAAPRVQTQVNARISGLRGKSPFQSLYGFNPKLAAAQLPHPIPIYLDPTQEYYQLAENLTKAKKQQLEQANKNRRPAPEYKVGDLVLLSTQNLTPYSKETKLHFKWIGPFPITQVNKWKQSYHLDVSEYPELSRITPVFHTNLLKPYTPNDNIKFPSRSLKRPEAVEGQWYKVEKAVEFRTEPGTKKRQYKIRWQGYLASEDSWVNAEEISKEVLVEFWTTGNKGVTYKRRKGRKTRDGNTRPETLEMLRKEKEEVLKEITTQAQKVKAESQYLLLQLPPKQQCNFCFELGHHFEHCYRAP